MSGQPKIFLTVDEAMDMFKSQQSAHSINVIGHNIMGFEWSISGAREKLETCTDLQIAGDTARGMGHGIAATEPDGDFIFFEHDEAALTAFIAERESTPA
ncbi:MAG: hypothetical protein IT551_08825 [Novosphingobium sp.]|nr:hypothetical protein [Novosphingobium sp.]